MTNYDVVIGGRIPQDLMDRVRATGLSNTEIINEALTYYLNYVVNKKREPVNKEVFENKYQDLCLLIDKHLSRLNEVF